MAWKLLRWFVSHDIALNPPDPAVLEFAHYLRGSDNAAYPQRRYPYDFRAALRKLFLSKYFYDNAHFYNMYKTPADYVTMSLRMLDSADLFTNEFGPGVQMVLMGQILFNPPNVSGWQNGKTWITSSSLVQRYNYGFWVTEVVMRGDAADERIDNLLAANGGPISTAESFDELIDYYRERLIQAEITAEERAVLTSMMQGVGGFDPGRFRSRVRALIHAMMAMPIVQLK
jgi:uncharacterized protein (DUF1800 family)